jgi:FkbM family methyltransferase
MPQDSSQSQDDYSFRYGHTTLRVPRSEPYTYYATYLVGEWDLLRIRPGDVILGAGANVGDFTIRAALRTGPLGKVIAVEPSPVATRYLRLNLAENNICNVVVSEFLLSDQNGPAWVRSEGSYLVKSTSNEPKSRPVIASSIDHLLDELGVSHVDVVKMDIEGGEGDALRGALFLRYVREICVETHSSELEKEILTNLRREHFELRPLSKWDISWHASKCLTSHLASFVHAEAQTGGYGLKSALSALGGKAGIPAVTRRSDVRIYYGRRKEGSSRG